MSCVEWAKKLCGGDFCIWIVLPVRMNAFFVVPKDSSVRILVKLKAS